MTSSCSYQAAHRCIYSEWMECNSSAVLWEKVRYGIEPHKLHR